MEQQSNSLTKFLPGNHLVLGAAGSGKTRLIWSLLQSTEFNSEDTINIVLTDSAHRIWNSAPNPIHIIDPYATDMRWIAEPSEPGIYFTACDYVPRVITFLESLANFVRRYEENIPYPIRLFVDFPLKFWHNAAFIGQVERLHFISESLTENGSSPLRLWIVLTPFKELSPEMFRSLHNFHLVVLNPASDDLLADINRLFGPKFTQVNAIAEELNLNNTAFKYVPTPIKIA